MAKLSDFSGKKPTANSVVMKAIKSGSIRKITGCEVKTTSKRDDDCIAIKVEGFDKWIRVNENNLEAFIEQWGDDTDKIVGKRVKFEYQNKELDGKPIIQLDLIPSK